MNVLQKNLAWVYGDPGNPAPTTTSGWQSFDPHVSEGHIQVHPNPPGDVKIINRNGRYFAYFHRRPGEAGAIREHVTWRSFDSTPDDDVQITFDGWPARLRRWGWSVLIEQRGANRANDLRIECHIPSRGDRNLPADGQDVIFPVTALVGVIS